MSFFTGFIVGFLVGFVAAVWALFHFGWLDKERIIREKVLRAK